MTRNTHVAADTDPPAITAILARFVSTHPGRGWNDAVEREAVRTFYNWLGCAIGAARHPAADAALAALQMLEPAPQAAVLGRSERLDMASAALLNGITSHTFDFDDTHLKTIIHPAAPVASAILALAEQRGASGRALLDALVIGIDVACRIGNAMYPEHYDRGWHITGSTGMLGAAAGCARLLGLDTQQTGMALGIAASQPIGLREQFGTMTKPFHPGAAARAGMLSALLASKGFTASARALEAPRGFVQVVSNKRAWHEVSDALGERFEISFNTYKPFACGIVIHPGIDACVQLRAQGVQPQQVERIELRVHPLVLELTGKKTPRDGLEAKFSVYHGCAVGLIFGRAGEAEFRDEIVNRADVMALRGKVHATVDDSIDEAAADVTAVLRDGRSLHVRIGHAIGSLQRPLDDAQLDDKFMSLVEPVLGRAKGTRIGQECRALATLADMRALTALCVP
ncbi:MmgE/PrpD family protein [Verminephrobacter eiseniae]|uniref:MmgE/PrpD family protein n=1 Tax=Verminephrobacter eiseniae (strain EF01-2) TaxID=391735 RepID=A1WEY8_VEREI|nr:MmgE/PrpD family protein [Verminephrobacter eiseniae]ABM56195.1 MmgE/PrpD family protein [Verminephrobacter eiseniae EF01-2]MCW5286566.1 MmgE/PrpD family protein [Verminephrobacter eiseniae]MCW5304865.1 MmgE/PrpD family protein [Verminephrobacter eiseniae]MCW8178303.1 MmgE/PrpD family protein [Verminephrobacter eiseniae]MCW8190035.1 MmgE/PrpD family protein [Verminephrobacter eiseniae]